MCQSQQEERGVEREKEGKVQCSKSSFWSPAVSPHLCHPGPWWLWASDCLCSQASSTIKCVSAVSWSSSLSLKANCTTQRFVSRSRRCDSGILVLHFIKTFIIKMGTKTLTSWEKQQQQKRKKTSVPGFHWLLFLKMKRINWSLAKASSAPWYSTIAYSWTLSWWTSTLNCGV